VVRVPLTVLASVKNQLHNNAPSTWREETTMSTTLNELQPGDKVTIRRNLDHPAWMIRGAYDPYEGRHVLVRNPDIAEEIGVGTVTERRTQTQHGWITSRDDDGRIWNHPTSTEKTLVRVSNGFWYDCASGSQENSSATLIEPVR
jgi:hypothetical protein